MAPCAIWQGILQTVLRVQLGPVLLTIGIDIGDAVASGTTCAFETLRSYCSQSTCHQGQWNSSTITCSEFKGCNMTLQTLHTQYPAIRVDTNNCYAHPYYSVGDNSTICPVIDESDSDGKQVCNSLQCYAGWQSKLESGCEWCITHIFCINQV